MKNQEITTAKDFQKNTLQTYSDSLTGLDVFRISKSKSLTEIRESKTITLATIKKEGGEVAVEKLIKQMVAILASQMNLANKISEVAIEAIGEDVYSIGYFLKVEELAYFFKELRKGTYGQMYENLNSEKVCTALNKFIAERYTYFERKNIERHHSTKESAAKRINEGAEFRKIHKEMLKRHNG